MEIKSLILIGLLFYFAIDDYKRYKINNKVILISIILGIILNFFDNNIFLSIKGIIIPFIFLYPLFIINIFPAGDIKILMFVGSILGYIDLFFIFVISIIISIIIVLVKYSKNNINFNHFFSYIKDCFFNKTIIKYNKESKIKFPFAVSMFLAVIIFFIFKNIQLIKLF